MEIKSTIIKRINQVRTYYFIVLLFFLIYNTIYGWNMKPINETEKLLDSILKFLLFFGVGWILSIGLDFMKFMVQVEINNLKHRNND